MQMQTKSHSRRGCANSIRKEKLFPCPLLLGGQTSNVFCLSLSQGKVYEREASPMGYDDFYQLGLAAQRSGDYGLAGEWLMLSASGPNDSIYKPDVLMELAQTHYYVSIYQLKNSLHKTCLLNPFQHGVADVWSLRCPHT